MARGWQSKAVEAQLEQAAQTSTVQVESEPAPVTFEQRQKLDSLRLMRSQMSEQLQRARSVAQRQMLHQQLQAIDGEIISLESRV